MPPSTTRKRPYNDENADISSLRTPLLVDNSLRTPLSPRKISQENFTTPVNTVSPKPLIFLDGAAPVPKRRRFARALMPGEHEDLIRQRQERDAERRKGEARRAADEEEARNRVAQEQLISQVNKVLHTIEEVGFPSVYDFLQALFTTRGHAQFSKLSRLLITRGPALLEDITCCQPKIAHDWALSTCRQLVDAESIALAAHFRPHLGSTVTEHLRNFSMEGFLFDAQKIAPTIYQILRQIAYPPSEDSKYKKRDLILSTTLCLLAKSRNDHSTQFQTTMALYFLACGTSRSVFDALNHAGITLSYTQALQKLKDLGQERLVLLRKIAQTRAFMIAWDNVNMAFKVSQQRHDSKDHFDSGTTSTLVPLYGVDLGDLPLSMNPPRLLHAPILDFDAEDLLPSCEEAIRVQEGQLWHIKDILFDALPELRKRLAQFILPPPAVMQIPLHVTEQYPLPAMHIDESSLDGTLHVLSTIFGDSLKLSEEDIERHGIILCAGDQMSISLLDKVSALRRDDTKLMDNISRYTHGQDGLLHVKFAAARTLANEYWGKPNSKSPWSLWKVNTLLGRKAISAGWKAKSLPPFRPVYELMLDLTLPANILDGFRIYCPKDNLEDWVKTIKSIDEVEDVAQQVLDQLCSGRRVEKLRANASASRDVPLENIILFNRDCLHLRQLKFAIKRGDVGVVLDVITHLMLTFRGTGHTPKYADALFHIVVNLKRMDPKLRKAWLMNWLANLTGKENGFKEMDLLQEHQNFWLKIIYNAKGSNRSWEWLSMVSVSIFALRDVIRKVQNEFVTPFNSTAHTTPSTSTDIATLTQYLQDQHLQSYIPKREHNDEATTVRDLMEVGSEYANKPAAFRSFKYAKFKTTYESAGTGGLENPEHKEEDALIEDNDDEDIIQPGSDLEAEVEDIFDEDELPCLAIFRDIIDRF